MSDRGRRVRGAISRSPHESLQSEVARGGVEPPTFRFSDLGSLGLKPNHYGNFPYFALDIRTDSAQHQLVARVFREDQHRCAAWPLGLMESNCPPRSVRPVHGMHRLECAGGAPKHRRSMWIRSSCPDEIFRTSRASGRLPLPGSYRSLDSRRERGSTLELCSTPRARCVAISAREPRLRDKVAAGYRSQPRSAQAGSTSSP